MAWLEAILLISISLLIVVLAVQDFKTRLVRLELLIGVFLLSVSLLSIQLSGGLALKLYGWSTLVIVLVVAVLWVYSRIRFKNKVDFFKEVFAIGDVVFLLAIGGMFSILGLGLFLFLSSLSAVISTIATRSLNKEATKSVPFVTYMGVTFVLLMVFLNVEPDYYPYLSERLFNLNKISYQLP